MTAIHIHPDTVADVRANTHAADTSVTVRAQWTRDTLCLHFCDLTHAASFASRILDALDEMQKEAARPAEPIGVFVGKQEF